MTLVKPNPRHPNDLLTFMSRSPTADWQIMLCISIECRRDKGLSGTSGTLDAGGDLRFVYLSPVGYSTRVLQVSRKVRVAQTL